MRRSDLFEYDVGCFKSFEDGLNALGTGSYHLALVDYYLGDATGLELVREARARS